MDEQLRIAALEYHRTPTPGKISVTPTKVLVNQHDLALAYSPGVAAACDAIVADPAEARTLTSRGNLVDEQALERALDAGRIAGCAMDVGRAPDQMPTPRLARHPKVIATPHAAGLTQPAIEHQSLETVAQVAEILQGRAPRGAVNADRATRLARLKR